MMSTCLFLNSFASFLCWTLIYGVFQIIQNQSFIGFSKDTAVIEYIDLNMVQAMS